MIGLRKKQPFPLNGTLYTDFGLPLPNGIGGTSSPPAVSALQSLGIRHVVWTAEPLAITNTITTNWSSRNDIITSEVISFYWLDEAFEVFVQQHPLETYREKYVPLVLKEAVSVRALKGPLFEIRARGYEPIILYHNPRSTDLRRTAIQYLSDLGCLFQLDLMALTGMYGARVKTQAESWLSHGLFSVLTTGIRGAGDITRLKNLIVSPMVATALEETIERHTRLTCIFTT